MNKKVDSKGVYEFAHLMKVGELMEYLGRFPDQALIVVGKEQYGYETKTVIEIFVKVEKE